MLLNGSYNARLALVGGSMVIGVLALAAAIVAARDGDTGPLGWTVMVLRLALPAAATVFCFLPGTRQYFTGNMG
jgi:F0F1-type ATP synthase membrane subunit c/vacuolar-type H+-ATPase subunit K